MTAGTFYWKILFTFGIINNIIHRRVKFDITWITPKQKTGNGYFSDKY